MARWFRCGIVCSRPFRLQAYEEMLAGEDVSGRVVSVSEGRGSKRGKYSVEYEWTDYRGARHQGKTTARSDFLGSLEAGDRIVLGVDPVDPERAKPKEYMRERKPVRLGPLVGTDTLYVGAFMVVAGILVAIFVRP
ncbi:MAG: DUF3592 domain-containing protein [bacterium]|nr:DUF3592 domain-containing protein [bacterium]